MYEIHRSDKFLIRIFLHIDSKLGSSHPSQIGVRYSLLDERLCDLVMAVKCRELGSTGSTGGRLGQKSRPVKVGPSCGRLVDKRG